MHHGPGTGTGGDVHGSFLRDLVGLRVSLLPEQLEQALRTHDSQGARLRQVRGEHVGHAGPEPIQAVHSRAVYERKNRHRAFAEVHDRCRDRVRAHPVHLSRGILGGRAQPERADRRQDGQREEQAGLGSLQLLLALLAVIPGDDQGRWKTEYDEEHGHVQHLPGPTVVVHEEADRFHGSPGRTQVDEGGPEDVSVTQPFEPAHRYSAIV